MRTRKLLALAGVAALSLAASAVTVTIDRVQQRYPWNELVDIDYTLDGDVDSSAIFKVEAIVDGTAYQASTFKGTFAVTKGTHRVTWDAKTDGVQLFTTNATFGLSITIEKPAGYDTVVFDLDKGTYKTLTVGTNNYASLNTYENKTTNLVMRVIPAQTYTTVPAHYGQFQGYLPHSVTVSSFLAGVFELTQGQYRQVSPGAKSPLCNGADDLPVMGLYYEEVRGATADGYDWPKDGHAVAPSSVIGLLRAKFDGKIEFDLLTEGQWGAMAQAGSTARFGYLGDSLTAAQSKTVITCGLADMAKVPAVGAHAPNPYGIWDVMGSVWDGVLDWIGNPNSEDGGINPTGPQSGTYRCYRGGPASATINDFVEMGARAQRAPDMTMNRNAQCGYRLAAPLVK